MRKGGASSQQPRPPKKMGSNVRPSFRSTKIEKALKDDGSKMPNPPQLDVDKILKVVDGGFSKNEFKKENALRMPTTNMSSANITDKFAWNMASPVADQRRIMRYNEDEFKTQMDRFHDSGEQPVSSTSNYSSNTLCDTLA